MWLPSTATSSHLIPYTTAILQTIQKNLFFNTGCINKNYEWIYG